MAKNKFCILMFILASVMAVLTGCHAVDSQATPESRSSVPVAGTESSKAAASYSQSSVTDLGSHGETAVPTATQEAPGETAITAASAGGSAPVLGNDTGQPAISPVNVDAQPVRVVQVIRDFMAGEHSYGMLLVVENPNPDLAMQDTRCRLTSYDSGGAILETDECKIGLLFPGELRTIYMSILAQGNTPVAKLEFAVTEQGQPVETSLTNSSLSSERVKYWPDSGEVTGLIRNNSEYLISMPILTVLLYDEQGQVIGVGNGMSHGFAPPKSQAGISVNVPYHLSPARIELLAVPEGAWSIHPIVGSHSTLRVGQVLSVQDVYDDSLTNAVFFVANPNADLSIGPQPFQVTVYDGQGFVLGTQASFTPVVFPGEEVAAMAGLFSIPRGSSIADIEVQVSPVVEDSNLLDYGALGIERNPFSITDAYFEYDEYNHPSVTCVLRSTWKNPVAPTVMVVAYDAGGKIVGFGSNSAPYVSAKEQVNVTTGLTMAIDYSGVPARIETFAYVGNPTEIRLEP